MKNIVYALAALLVTASGEAQAPPAERPALLRGFVLTDSTEAPIVGAEVMIDALNIRVRTVADGSFRLPDIAPGMYIVRVRAVGYKQIWAPLAFADRDSLERDFLLVRSPVAIAGVRVTGKADIRNPKITDFERRRALGIGSFLSQERIDSSAGSPTELLHAVECPASRFNRELDQCVMGRRYPPVRLHAEPPVLLGI